MSLFLYIGVTLASFSSSGKTHFCIDKLQIWSNGLCKELNYIETYIIITRTFTYLKGIIWYRIWIIWMYSITLFEIIIKFYCIFFPFFRRFWTNFCKKRIKILGSLWFICERYIINNNLFGKILFVVKFTFANWIFNNFPVFLTLFLKASINLEKWFLIASNKFLCFLY